MSKDLLRYYESELTFIQQLAHEFAEKYPKIAGRLDLDNNESSDPHVERLIQAFAMLTGRIRHKIDDEFPEVVESLLNILYPHYLRPIPPLAIGQFQVDPQQGRPTEPAQIPAGSVLHSRPGAGAVCTFKTCYPVTVWPLQVTSAVLGSVSSTGVGKAPSEATAALRIQLETLGGLPASALNLQFLRFYLNGEGSSFYELYELLLVHAAKVQIRPRKPERELPSRYLPDGCIQPVGFDPSEGVLPYTDRTFLGYRLLQEYFEFPQKFLFFDIQCLSLETLAELGTSFEIVIFFRDSELQQFIPSISQTVGPETFQLGCTPDCEPV